MSDTETGTTYYWMRGGDNVGAGSTMLEAVASGVRELWPEILPEPNMTDLDVVRWYGGLLLGLNGGPLPEPTRRAFDELYNLESLEIAPETTTRGRPDPDSDDYITAGWLGEVAGWVCDVVDEAMTEMCGVVQDGIVRSHEDTKHGAVVAWARARGCDVQTIDGVAAAIKTGRLRLTESELCSIVVQPTVRAGDRLYYTHSVELPEYGHRLDQILGITVDDLPPVKAA